MCCMLHVQNQNSNCLDAAACILQFCWPKINKLILKKYFSNFTWRFDPSVWRSHPPKYQKTLCKVAPQPYLAIVSSPYSKFKSSFTLPKQLESIFEKKLKYLPSKSTINGLLLARLVLRTSTAFSCGLPENKIFRSYCFSWCFWKRFWLVPHSNI